MALICYHGTTPHNIDQSRADIVLKAISDKDIRKIITCIKDEPKSVRQISYDTGLLVSNVYRKIHELKKNKLLIISASISSENHKKVFSYKSKVRKVAMMFNDDDDFDVKIYSNIHQ